MQHYLKQIAYEDVVEKCPKIPEVVRILAEKATI
jgi:hypothetical protein